MAIGAVGLRSVKIDCLVRKSRNGRIQAQEGNTSLDDSTWLIYFPKKAKWLENLLVMLIDVKKSMYMYRVNKKLKKERKPKAGSFLIFNSLCNINWRPICRTSGLENGRRDPSRWPRGTLYPQKLTLTSPTSGGRSVGIFRSRTQATEFSPYIGHSSVSNRMNNQSPKPFPNHYDCSLSNINVTRPKGKLTLHLSTTSCELTGCGGESQYIANRWSRLRRVYSLTQPPRDLGSSSPLERKLSSINGRYVRNGEEKVLPLPKN
jgi:hypothetical protein